VGTDKEVDWERDQCIAHFQLCGWEPRRNKNTGQYVLWHPTMTRMLHPIHVIKKLYCGDTLWETNIPALSGEYADWEQYNDVFLRQAVTRTLEKEDATHNRGIIG
jgi:hypothetical protein